VSFETEGDHK